MSYSPAISADALLAGFRALGLDPRVLAEKAGIAGRDLQEPDAVLPDEAFGLLWSEAMRLMPHDELPTEVGFAIPFGSFGIVDYLAGSAETVEAGILALRDHFRAVVFGLALDLVADGDGAWLRVVTTTAGSAPVGEEFTIAVTMARFRALADGPFPLEAVELTRPAPSSPTRHAELYQSPVSFAHATAGVRLPAVSLSARLRGADPILRRMLGQVAERLFIGGDKTPELEMAIRGRLRDLLKDGSADAISVARSLGLSERSLHRRLADLGRTYQAVLDDFRAGEAERLLLDSRVPLAQVALALGFADQTAFSRAFRRWKGETPKDWLTQRRAERAR